MLRGRGSLVLCAVLAGADAWVHAAPARSCIDATGASASLPRGATPTLNFAAQPANHRRKASVLRNERSHAHMTLRGGSIGASISSMLAGIVAVADGLPALIILGTSIALEVVATTFMKLASKGKPGWFVGVFLAYGLCFSIFPLALRRLSLSVAYATWSGVGTAASVVIGAGCFGEQITALKLLWIGFIVVGVIGLNV